MVPFEANLLGRLVLSVAHHGIWGIRRRSKRRQKTSVIQRSTQRGVVEPPALSVVRSHGCVASDGQNDLLAGYL